MPISDSIWLPFCKETRVSCHSCVKHAWGAPTSKNNVSTDYQIQNFPRDISGVRSCEENPNNAIRCVLCEYLRAYYGSRSIICHMCSQDVSDFACNIVLLLLCNQEDTVQVSTCILSNSSWSYFLGLWTTSDEVCLASEFMQRFWQALTT